MKKPHYLIISAILLLIPIITIYYFYGKAGSPQAEGDTTASRSANANRSSSEGPSSARSSRRVVTENPEADRLRRELKNAYAQLEKLDKLSAPLSKEMFSSTVDVEIAAGETLVTGGYKRADGKYELTFMTPTTVTMEDGTEMIKLFSRVLAVDSEFVKANGLGTLATNARNTLQHAEAWNQEEMTATMKAASQNDNSEFTSPPAILTSPSSSKPFTLNMGEPGKASYSIESTIGKTATGGFAIKARVERAPLQSGAN
jgi:hypothetical protein